MLSNRLLRYFQHLVTDARQIQGLLSPVIFGFAANQVLPVLQTVDDSHGRRAGNTATIKSVSLLGFPDPFLFEANNDPRV